MSEPTLSFNLTELRYSLGALSVALAADPSPETIDVGGGWLLKVPRGIQEAVKRGVRFVLTSELPEGEIEIRGLDERGALVTVRLTSRGYVFSKA